MVSAHSQNAGRRSSQLATMHSIEDLPLPPLDLSVPMFKTPVQICDVPGRRGAMCTPSHEEPLTRGTEGGDGRKEILGEGELFRRDSFMGGDGFGFYGFLRGGLSHEPESWVLGGRDTRDGADLDEDCSPEGSSELADATSEEATVPPRPPRPLPTEGAPPRLHREHAFTTEIEQGCGNGDAYGLGCSCCHDAPSEPHDAEWLAAHGGERHPQYTPVPGTPLAASASASPLLVITLERRDGQPEPPAPTPECGEGFKLPSPICPLSPRRGAISASSDDHNACQMRSIGTQRENVRPCGYHGCGGPPERIRSPEVSLAEHAAELTRKLADLSIHRAHLNAELQIRSEVQIREESSKKAEKVDDSADKGEGEIPILLELKK